MKWVAKRFVDMMGFGNGSGRRDAPKARRKLRRLVHILLREWAVGD